jgi:uncharacterized protein YecT (DUF1311 family)
MNVKHFARCTFLFSFSVLIVPQICCAQQKKRPKSCWDTALTQLAMNECAGKELRAEETRLEALLKRLGVGPDDLAQKAWEGYRDAQLEAIYARENGHDYGSVYPMCFAQLRTKLVKGRIRDLNALTTSGEGDVCYGLKSIAERQRDKPAALTQKTATTPAGRNLSSDTR